MSWMVGSIGFTIISTPLLLRSIWDSKGKKGEPPVDIKLEFMSLLCFILREEVGIGKVSPLSSITLTYTYLRSHLDERKSGRKRGGKK